MKGNIVMKCDWVFLKKDGSKLDVTLEGATPEPGDGKFHANVGYVVRHIINGRTTTPNPAVIATEQ
jgi:hypothetical protein